MVDALMRRVAAATNPHVVIWSMCSQGEARMPASSVHFAIE
jgi:hypothetical protein